MSWPVGFERPLWFVLLPLVLVVWHLGRRRVGRRWRIATVLRAALLALLVVVLAGPVVTVPMSGARVVFVADRSESISADDRLAETAFVRNALARMHPDDRAAVVTFAGRPLLQAPLVSRTGLNDLAAAPAPDATDIGAGIDLARAVLPRDGARRIVVLSDGVENAGDAVAAARRAAAEGVAIDAVPLGATAPPEVLVDDVVTPTEVHTGEAYDVRAVLHATVAAAATVTLSRNGTPIATRRVSLQPGDTAVSFSDRTARESFVRYRVDVTSSADPFPGNKHGEAVVLVRGEPRVLFVAEDPTVLPQWLARQGLRVDTVAPGEVPTTAAALAPYGSVVLDDIGASDLSAEQQAALQSFVGTLGGGLVVAGGPHSYGVGGYAGTPLEAMLPVKMDVREHAALPTVAIVLVLDVSGSMEAFGSELAKVDLAKEIASSTIDLLSPQDMIGVIAFNNTYRWLVPPTEARYKDRILDEVSRLQAGGGTIMYPPLVGAQKYLLTSRAKVRHVIAITDGLTDPGDFRTLVTQMARDKLTVSTVAIGSDADLNFLRNVARWGNGRAYVAKNFYNIPEIFTTEAYLAVRSYVVEEPTPLSRAGETPTLAGLGTPPPIQGYVATVAKPTGNVALEGPRRDPVLATWQYGLGRTVAFTSDDGTRWTTQWAAWPGAARFWSQAVRWTLRDPGSGLYLSLSRDPRDARARMVLDARRPDGSTWDGLTVAADVQGPDGASHRLDVTQTAPGQYEASWPAGAAGTYAVTLAARGPNGTTGTRAGALVVPYSTELRDLGNNPALLAQLTEETGGLMLRAPEDAFRSGSGRGQRNAWPPVAAFAAALLLAEVTVRRVPAVAQRLGALSAAVASVVGGRGTVSAARQAEDDAYAAADRWAADDARFAEEEKLRAASMNQAARLYIARLRGGGRPK